MVDTYKCASCGRTLNKGWTDEEAKAELEEEFPGYTLEECALVCDDCYKGMGFGK